MARREYVSFLGERRRDLGSERGPDPTRWLWLVTAVALIAVSVWWFGFRVADEEAVTERVLQDTTIPTLLLPTGVVEDDDLVSENLECRSVIESWSTFQGGPERQGCISTRRIENPRVLWRSEVGISGWLDNPVIADGAVYVGSAGVAQFSQDRLDGIHSVDLVTGQRRWFYTTELDVNAVSVSGNYVVATGDEGRIWVIDAGDGDLVWTELLGVAVFGSPLILGDTVYFGAGDGSVLSYDLSSGDRLKRQSVEGPVRGGVSSDGEYVYVAGETHQVVKFSLALEQVWRVEVLGRGANPEDARIFAAPTITEDLVIVTLVRSDTGADPAIVALDKETGEEVWRSEDQASIKNEWANIRSSPAVAGDFLVYGEGYSDKLVVLDLATGETVWAATVGPFCYPHWPSVAVNNGYAYIARHDGGLYAVDLSATQEPEYVWRIYLGIAADNSFPEGHTCDWGPETGFSILASPAVSPEGIIVIGTLEGQLMAIGDSDW